MVDARGALCRTIVTVFVLGSLAACEGPAGPPGPMGDRGPAGASGLDVVASTLCQAQVTGATTGALIYALSYTIVEYSNSAVWTSCSVGDGYTQSASSNYYDASQNGAVTHGCLVATDANGTFGWWNFRLGGAGYSATYTDADSSNDGYVFEFLGPSSTEDGCTTFTP